MYKYLVDLYYQTQVKQLWADMRIRQI